MRAHPEVKKYWVDSGDPAQRARLAYDASYAWQLYDLAQDRTEVDNVADQHPEIVQDLSRQWQAWAERVGVVPFDAILDAFAARGLPYREAIG